MSEEERMPPPFQYMTRSQYIALVGGQEIYDEMARQSKELTKRHKPPPLDIPPNLIQ